MTWKQQAALVIERAVRDLPAEASLDDRRKRVDAARPYWCSEGWPRKAWQAARRDHLVRYGYRPRTKKQRDLEAAALAPLPLFP